MALRRVAVAGGAHHNISPNDNRQVHLRRELAELARADKKTIQAKCKQLTPEKESPAYALSDDTEPTLLRKATFALLELYDGSDQDVPDVLRGQLSPYKPLTVSKLEALYEKKYRHSSPAKTRKPDLLAALVNYDRREHARQGQSNYDEQEKIRQDLTRECFDVFMDPELGLLRGAATFTKTFFDWCAKDVSHVPDHVLQERVNFLEEFNPKKMKESTEGTHAESVCALVAVDYSAEADLMESPELPAGQSTKTTKSRKPGRRH